ncbi:glucose-6-phosphate isomerase [Candidatus Omnitrophota bacterium]
MSIKLDQAYLKGFIDSSAIEGLRDDITTAHNDLENKTGAGNEYLGWANLAASIEDSFLDELVALGQDVRAHSDCIVSIGIGGSYLGIRAVCEYVRNKTDIPIYYAGHNISVDYMTDLLEKIKDKRVTLVVISKSGTTTEPAIAFRILKKALKEKYSEEELKKRIICVTDAKKGALRKAVDAAGYRSFIIPDDVGGRFSVLTPVGLVPLALAGVDIKSLVAGARVGEAEYAVNDLSVNIAYQYAAIRFLLFNAEKRIEVTSSFYDNMHYVGEWWKQLYGESEGKEGKGLFPASLIFSTDLHSMGQLMQEGVRNIFETFIDVETCNTQMSIPEEPENLDNFNLVAGRDLNYVNEQAHKATASAHFEGGVPNMTLMLEKCDLFHLGQLFSFYTRAVAISGYLLKVNPFDQPGVEAYKKKMFALLGRV